jgi:hypothetical protein
MAIYTKRKRRFKAPASLDLRLVTCGAAIAKALGIGSASVYRVLEADGD